MGKINKTILHVIDTTGPGGAETIFTQLANDSKENGFKTIALIRGAGWVLSELNRLNVDVVVENCKGSFNLHFLLFLIRLIKKEKVDVVQSHLLGSNVYASLAGLISGVPVISTFHGFVDISAKEKFSVIKFLSIRFGSKKVIAVTDQINQMLASVRWLNAKKNLTIANGIDTDIFRIKSNYEFSNGNTFRIGCLGNVRSAKNYPLALNALKLLCDEGLNVELHIAGDDTNNLAVECKALAESLGVSDRVVWHGFIDDACAYLHSLDLFLLCSTSEGHPLALTQAMSCGLPIVVTPCGVEHIIQHSVNGLVSDQTEECALVASIKKMFISAEARKKLGSAAAASVRERYSLNATMIAYRKEYCLGLQYPLYKPNAYLKHVFGGRRGFLALMINQLKLKLLKKDIEYMLLPARISRVVFVCKGNICRSALAEWVFRKNTDFPTASFGVDTTTGCPADPRITQIASLFDVDLDEHKTTAQPDFIPALNDLYVCVEPSHADVLKKTMPGKPIFYLGAMLDTPCVYLHDPHTASDDFALRSVATITTAVERLVGLLNVKITSANSNV